jgi:hypothetical protein
VATPCEQDLPNIADKIAVGAGAIERCAAHPHITIDCLDDDAAANAYALGALKVKNGEVGYSHEEVRAAIHAAIRESAGVCPECSGEEREGE